MSSLAPVSSNERLAHADDGASAAHPPTPDVVTLGEPMIELASGRTVEDQYTFGWGGDVSNFAVAAARLGAQPAIITRVGDDPFGQSLQSLWTREGVDTRFVEIVDRQPTGLYVMTRDAAGRHAFQYYRRGSAASYLGPADIPESIATARTVHVSGISMAISDSAREATFRALRLASEANVPITLDPNVRERLWSIELARAVIGHALAFADVAFPSLEDGAALAGREDPEAIVDWMLSRGTRMVVLKLGEEGCLVATRTSSQLVPGAEVKAVDTAGAGDTFAAAFVTATLEGRNAIDSARFANAAAALTTTGLGCVRPIPRRNAVERLLAATPSTGQDGQPPLHTHKGTRT